MPRAFDKPEQQENYVQSNWTVGITAVCWIALICLVALMSNSPAASTWVSEASQAEIAGSTMTSDSGPVQIAAGKIH
ncbi:MAG: hypothetical protein QOD09_377 [Bradyrhizobium sp.]|jgi:hypothetical protein|nr:hypothetical protein [Bradyrhizobium sp.]